ncbi:hypothetical protein OAA60_00750 [Porticoccaceae bacterium]|nr:hypothetical protein [Porticoccaceae bacterium]
MIDYTQFLMDTITLKNVLFAADHEFSTNSAPTDEQAKLLHEMAETSLKLLRTMT